MFKMFQYEVMPNKLYTVDGIIDGDFYTKKVN